MPRQYTATARILIEPPAGMDPRSSITVSPIYLESLKNVRAVRVGRQPVSDRRSTNSVCGRHPVEAVKRRVLKVQLVRNTRILEISATLPDPVKAQALAQFVAEATVELNRSTVLRRRSAIWCAAWKQQERDRARLDAESAWAQAWRAEPVDALQAAMERMANCAAACSSSCRV